MKGKTTTVLVTGGTGLLGKGMGETKPNGWRILSLHQRDYAVEDSRADHLVLDIRDKAKVDELFAKHPFDAVVHAAGIASVDYVERHYAESLESNIVGTLNITSASRRAGVYLVYVSTNAVFDGKKAPYAEDAPVNPVNKYGRLKVECERLVAETLKDYAIVRPILMYGWNHPVCRPNPATWIIEKLMRGEAVQLVDDVIENPLYNIQCGEALWALLKKRATGIFHLAGGETVNRYEFGRRIAEVFGLDASLLKRVDSSAFPDIAARPPNTTFVTRRMSRELGVPAMTLREGLAHMKAHARVKS
ncbi:MAG: SDR family oxidoreductase [Elusimicrobia bacterium]|nr:SDR family oxidoreductase [Elusimicrobiota bacterium]